MLKTTRWSPDTCGCVFEYEWDTEESEQTRTHVIKKAVETCAAHASQPTLDLKFNQSLNENRMKNTALRLIAEALPEFGTIDGEGNVIPDLKKLGFEFDEERNLSIKTKGLSDDQKAIVDPILEKNFGENKVTVTA